MYRKHNEWEPILITGLPKGLAPKAVINNHPGAALQKHGGRMAVDNRGYQEKTNGNTGSILNADGNANPVTMSCNGKMKFATLWKMDMQLLGKTFCNFVEKGLAKNIERKWMAKPFLTSIIEQLYYLCHCPFLPDQLRELYFLQIILVTQINQNTKIPVSTGGIFLLGPP